MHYIQSEIILRMGDETLDLLEKVVDVAWLGQEHSILRVIRREALMNDMAVGSEEDDRRRRCLGVARIVSKI